MQTHLATISFDGGEYVAAFEHLPPLTYVVEAQYEKAEEKLADRNVKVTKLTNEGKLPFKDERIDVIVNELSNYDKYDLYRVVKPEPAAAPAVRHIPRRTPRRPVCYSSWHRWQYPLPACP